MSQASARFIPAPAAAPLTAAMMGWGASRIARSTRSLSGATLSSTGRSARASLASFIAFTSPPEQKPLPAPVSTIARTSGIGRGAQHGVVEIVAQRVAQRVEPLRAVEGEGGEESLTA